MLITKSNKANSLAFVYLLKIEKTKKKLVYKFKKKHKIGIINEKMLVYKLARK